MFKPLKFATLIRFYRFPSLALLLCLWPSTSFAQTTAQIGGRILDPSGGIIKGAEVSATQIETSLRRTVSSNASGHFLIANLPGGTYQLRVTSSGFRPLVQRNLVLAVGDRLMTAVTLELGPIDLEEIVVLGDTSLVQTQTSDLSYLVERETLEELPLNGRNFTDLALLQPGMIAYRHRNSLGSIVAHGLAASATGRDPRSNLYLLDGTPQNDFTNGPAGSAAGTVLGVETIQEFQVATNSYGAEFGRNYGSQINAVTKSGTNRHHGSAYFFHRNDNLDARNFFDGAKKPEFLRYQFGASLGGAIKKDRWFYFLGYEGLEAKRGRSLTTTVPDQSSRGGLLPCSASGRPDCNPAAPHQLVNVGVNPSVAPYLNEYPLPNGGDLGGGLAIHNFLFNENTSQNFIQFRIDHNRNNQRFFARYTFDDAEIRLPTDFPQFPRTFLSRNQFVTLEYQNFISSMTTATFRGSYSRTNIGQEVEANTSSKLPSFVPGRALAGSIDVGGIPRFGPQVSVDVSLVQNVFGFETNWSHVKGSHHLKFGMLAEKYQDNMVNPTFSLGIFAFAKLATFLQNQPLRFIGLGPTGQFDRYWRFGLFGFYLQDDFRIHPRLTMNLGLRYEFATVPHEIRQRDVTLTNPEDTTPTLGSLYNNPTLGNVAPRLGLAWDVFGDGSTAIRSGYGLYYNTNNQQNLIVTVTNPPFTPRLIIPGPTFPNPPFERGIGTSLRPIEPNLKTPSVHVWNLNLQRSIWKKSLLTVGYNGSRGLHLLRNTDINIPTPERLVDGTLFWPSDSARPNSSFSTIEQKRSDGDSYYHALLLELRQRFSAGFSFQSSYTFSRSIDNTQASTFFSDANNGTTSAMPEFFSSNYNKGLSDFHAKHNWVVNFIWQIPFTKDLQGFSRKILDGWQLSGISNLQSGNPLTVFVKANRSRSRWSPSLRPGLGLDRPDLSNGYTHQTAVTGDPQNYFNAAAFSLQPQGTQGNLGRGALIGPNLRSFDLQAAKRFDWNVRGEQVGLQFRLEIFNLFNRTNFAAPSLTAFSGIADYEEPLPTLGRIRSTVTSSRQIQVGLRLTF